MDVRCVRFSRLFLAAATLSQLASLAGCGGKEKDTSKPNAPSHPAAPQRTAKKPTAERAPLWTGVAVGCAQQLKPRASAGEANRIDSWDVGVGCSPLMVGKTKADVEKLLAAWKSKHCPSQLVFVEVSERTSLRCTLETTGPDIVVSNDPAESEAIAVPAKDKVQCLALASQQNQVECER